MNTNFRIRNDSDTKLFMKFYNHTIENDPSNNKLLERIQNAVDTQHRTQKMDDDWYYCLKLAEKLP